MTVEEGMSLIVKTVSRILFPLMFLFGVYIIIHGHLTPGGGFPGGVVIASAVVMIVLAFGIERAQKEFGELQAELSESFGAFMLVGLGIVGIIVVGDFLGEVLPLGTLGSLFSGGNLPILNVGVGMKVGAGLITIIYAMLAVRK